MVLDPEPLAVGVDPLVRVRAETVHVTPRLRDSAVTHQPGHLVRGLGPQRPEVPLHVVVAQTGSRQSLLRVDEVGGELDRVLDEEDGRVVADEVVVAVLGVELDGESARVTPGVGGAALLAGDGGEAHERLGPGAGLEQSGLRVAAHVVGDDQFAERTAALGVDDALRDTLTIELGELLDQVVVVQQDGACVPAVRDSLSLATGIPKLLVVARCVSGMAKPPGCIG